MIHSKFFCKYKKMEEWKGVENGRVEEWKGGRAEGWMNGPPTLKLRRARRVDEWKRGVHGYYLPNHYSSKYLSYTHGTVTLSFNKKKRLP